MSLQQSKLPRKGRPPRFPKYRVPVLPPLDRARRELTFLAADPIGFYMRVVDRLNWSPEHRAEDRVIRPDEIAGDWDAQLHAHFGLSTPCKFAAEVGPIWSDALARMARQGIDAGPMTYLFYNDGDLGLSRAVWCLVRHLNAAKVVETGVAHGVTSRFTLEALARNGGGHLWSIDLPPRKNPELHGDIGAAVDERLHALWTYLDGTSRRHLPGVLKRAAPIDVFVHDSEHSTDNVLFELNLAWAALRPGGAVVVDDIDTNDGFHRFCETVHFDRALICEAEPARPDERRANRKGYFGIIIKAA